MTIAVWCNLFTVGKEPFNNSPARANVNPPSVSYLDEPYRPLYEASPDCPGSCLISRQAHPPANPIRRAIERSRELHQQVISNLPFNTAIGRIEAHLFKAMN